MRGTMMDFPLTLRHILERVGLLFPDREIVSRKPDRSLVRYTYADFYRRAKRLASALQRAGIRRGDRVATLMWNHSEHLEVYFGIPAAGAVVHTLNLRLHPDETAYIVNRAKDRFLIADDVLLCIYEKFRAKTKLERVIVVPYSCGAVSAEFQNYEEFLATGSENFCYPQMDENEAAAMCFTSGTTGQSKGVAYSHRALILHSFAIALPDVFNLSNHSAFLPATPMFHANAWGLPWACVMVGAKFVFPGPHLDAESLLNLMRDEGVTHAGGVPTIWFGVLAALEKEPTRWRFPQPISAICGGARPPESLVRGLHRFNLRILQGWGMTETSPVATVARLKAKMEEWPEGEKFARRAMQGIPAPFVEIRIMRPEGEVPHDGSTPGEIEVRGPWIAASYFDAPDQQHRWTTDGWLKTGDVGTIDAEGYLKIVDRAKDMIKSGGEWISSVDLENALMCHPAVREAAVIGVPHPKWQERPLAVVVLKDGAQATADELCAHLASKFAKWQLPDAFVFTNEIPRTSVGKFMKIKLREQYANWTWDTAADTAKHTRSAL